MDKDSYFFRFGADIGGEFVEFLTIDALGRFYIRGKQVNEVDEKEAIRVFHAIRDYATIISSNDD